MQRGKKENKKRQLKSPFEPENTEPNLKFQVLKNSHDYNEKELI